MLKKQNASESHAGMQAEAMPERDRSKRPLSPVTATVLTGRDNGFVRPLFPAHTPRYAVICVSSDAKKRKRGKKSKFFLGVTEKLCIFASWKSSLKMIMKNMIMKRILSLAMLFLPMSAAADFEPTAYYTVDGEEFEETASIDDGEAPLSVTFRANPDNLPDGTVPSYEWRFVRSGDDSPFLVRYEEDTQYDFTESGTYSVTLYVSLDGGDAEAEGTITVSISTSTLDMPNAFSPNGDGINDVYRAKSGHRSIVEFHAYIFNRHGVKLYEWTDIDGGWDGTYNGRPVNDGVYFVLVKAKGADGRTYNIRRDVNVLRDYIEGTNIQE